MEEIKHPTLKWAQRRDYVYLTVTVNDLDKTKVEIDISEHEQMLVVKAASGQGVYGFQMQMFAGLDKQKSGWNFTAGNHLFVKIAKKEFKSWPRLQKEKVKNQMIQIDWAKWIEEDSDNEDEPAKESSQE